MVQQTTLLEVELLPLLHTSLKKLCKLSLKCLYYTLHQDMLNPTHIFTNILKNMN